ncbi:MAG: MCP four helix bundle domain-containing protein [Proteobacteria bacterium]|nr:MCP four helix bundle domain-containing protein [Pseudomonadota bacterium]
MTHLRDIGIGTRLGIGFGVLMALAAFLGFIGLRYMGEINQRVENMYTQELVTNEVLDDAKSGMYRIRGDSLEHVLAKTDASQHTLASKINDQQKRIGERLSQYRATRQAPEEKALVDTFEKHFQAYFNRVEKEILVLSLANRDAEAEVLARGAAVEEFRKARDAMNALMDYSLERAKQRYHNSVADYRTAFWTVIAIIVAVAALGALVSVFLTRAIVRPMNALSSSEKRFTNIVNLAADAIISVDEEQRILIFN